jgi:Sec-independent protein translocase protein TatA
MNTVCGIGIPELVLLVLLILIVVGPERSREAALEIGRFLGKLLRSKWWKEISEIAQALRDLPGTLIRMAELEDMQSELRETLTDIQKNAKLDQEDRQILADMDETIEGLYSQLHNIKTPPTDQGRSQADQDDSEERG